MAVAIRAVFALGGGAGGASGGCGWSADGVSGRIDISSIWASCGLWLRCDVGSLSDNFGDWLRSNLNVNGFAAAFDPVGISHFISSGFNAIDAGGNNFGLALW